MEQNENGQDPSSTTPGSNEPNTQPTADQGANGQPQSGDEFDPARAKALIDKLRPFEKQATAQAKELEELKTKLQTFEDAQKTDEQKRAERLAALEQENTNLRTQTRSVSLTYEARLAAVELGIVDPDAAVKLADWTGVEYSDDGIPTNARTILEKLVADKPYLAAKAAPEAPRTPAKPAAPQPGASANPGRTAAGAANSTLPTFTESQISDRAFWVANRDAILSAMKNGRIVAG